ncbi:TetR/AcrR family transcriptional regulator [Mycolicibacterium cosmeticum]|uniref:TetR/AcrR family transcriptional regulator n=1 Tax=Mycolicibacterium cosmeticum TaxID=258533 RepID=UPI0032046A20
MRADALRNRSAILEAAECAYAEHGLDVSLNEIARRAGIGNATLYRHFGSHDALIAEVYAQHLERYCAIAEEAAAADDPTRALRDCITATCALQAANRGLAELLASLRPVSPHVESLRARHYVAITTVIERAVRSGGVREDLQPADVAILLMANTGLIQRTADDAPGSSARLVSVWLAGVLSPTVLNDPPAPTEHEISQALRRVGRAGGV